MDKGGSVLSKYDTRWFHHRDMSASIKMNPLSAMSNYLKTRYSEDKRPHTSYPAELVNYLFQRFNLKPSMKLLEPGVGRGEFLREFKFITVSEDRVIPVKG